MNIIDMLKTTNSKNPLLISYERRTTYFLTFIEILEVLKKELSEKEILEIVITKLQLSKPTFDKNAYYQAATELSVVFHMFCYKHIVFGYEKRLLKDSEKQPECSVTTINNFVYNAEAKCPQRDFIDTEKKLIERRIVIKNVGRAPLKKDAEVNFNLLKRELESKDLNLNVVKFKNNDNKLKDFLVSANNKFPQADSPKELNLLFVALDSCDEIQEYINYLFASKGLFGKDSFYNCNEYNKIDYVIFTNSFCRHKNNESINGNAWFLNEGFNIAIHNPSREEKKKELAIKDFFPSLGVWTNDIQSWKSDSVANLPQEIVNTLQVSAFIKEELEDKRHIFLFKTNEKI